MKYNLNIILKIEDFIPIDFQQSNEKVMRSFFTEELEAKTLANFCSDYKFEKEAVAISILLVLLSRYSKNYGNDAEINFIIKNQLHRLKISIQNFCNFIGLCQYVNNHLNSSQCKDASLELINDSISIEFNFLNDNVLMIINSPENLYSRDTLKRFVENYHYLLKSLPRIGKNVVKEISVVSSQERKWLLQNANSTAISLNTDKLIYDYIDEHSRKNPEKLALISDDKIFSYADLVRESQSLAAYLVSAGLSKGDFIGIHIKPSCDIVISMLAILRIGAVYVPLDDALPIARLKSMIEQCKLRFCLIRDQQDAEKINTLGLKTFNINKADIKEQYVKNESSNINNVAYINFSSGSTGKPKAIACTHRGVIRLSVQQDYMEFSDKIVMLQAAPYYFDVSTFEIWTTLISGGTCVVNGEVPLTNERLTYLISSYKINTICMASPMFHAMIDHSTSCFDGITQLLVGGDILSAKNVQNLYEQNQNIIVINGYGPTENTTNTSTYTISHGSLKSGGSIPIGRPLRGTALYILDEYENISPRSSIGELYIGGDGLAAGYVEDGCITTKNKFIFSNELGQRLYKTGDLVRYRYDGQLEFIGRVDNQIKINGYRVELEEIEFYSMKYPNVAQCSCILYKNDENRKAIILFLVVNKKSFSKVEFSKFIQNNLPKYMNPHEIILLNELPLKQTGKIDKKKLIQEYENTASHKLEEGNNVKTLLEKIWKQNLSFIEIRENTNFFESGGDSLMAIKCLNSINKHILDDRKLSTNTLYEYPAFNDFLKYVVCNFKFNFDEFSVVNLCDQQNELVII